MEQLILEAISRSVRDISKYCWDISEIADAVFQTGDTEHQETFIKICGVYFLLFLFCFSLFV